MVLQHKNPVVSQPEKPVTEMRNNCSKHLFTAIITSLLFAACSSTKNVNTDNQADISFQIKTDDSYKPKPASLFQAIKTQSAAIKGFCTVHKKDNKYYFEIPDSVLGKDILVVNRISKAAAQVRPERDYSGYGADQIGENVIQFYRGAGNKIFIKKIDYSASRSTDSSDNGLYKAVANSNLSPIMAVFDIKAWAPDSSSMMVDMTDYISSDNELFFFGGQQKRTYNLGSLQFDKSYVQSVSSFPLNIEIKTVKTFSNGNPGLAQSLPFLTYELNTSMVLLPKIPMKSRSVDERVGYFGRGYVDFDVPHPQGFNNSWLVTRWRLEPKPEDVEKYNNGELVEPQKPIVYYIDPATPKKWVPYLVQGVNAWRKAFEKAGFKNAITAMEAPLNDPEWSLEDTRHSAIVYKASWVQNASGPNVNDPRTGEILESHINWYHNITEVLHDWYFVQASPSDTTARKMILDDSLMGKLITFVCSHEVGHTLGLAHNFAASSTVPVDSLRSKQWVDANGICPSIMDYARFNYVAQPEDCMEQQDLIPRIGAYDEWAIEWGYRWLPSFADAAEEKAYLNKWVIKKLEDPKLLYAYGGAKCQAEDLGDDAVKAGTYGIQNLKRITPQLLKWTVLPNENYEAAGKMEEEVIDQYRRYIMHVCESIGGRYFTPKTTEQNGKVVEYVSKEKQQNALIFLQQQLFKTPEWLLGKEIESFTGGNEYDEVLSLQKEVLSRLMSAQTMTKLVNHQAVLDTTAFTPNQLFNELEKSIWLELETKTPVNMYQRNLQKAYVAQLIALQKSIEASPGSNIAMADVLSVVKAHKIQLQKKVAAALPRFKNEATKWHLADVADRLEHAGEMNAQNTRPSTGRYGFNDDTDEAAADQVPTLEKQMQIKSGNCWKIFKN